MAAPQDDYLKDTSQFDVARKRVQQQSATNLQGKRDALQRRFAQLGNLDSGARMKIEQQAEQEEAVNTQNANEGIDAAQQAEMGRRREIMQQQQFAASEAEKGRSFAKGEREAGQLFSGEQAAIQRKYMTGEREAGQKFAAGESALARDQQAGQFDKSYGLQLQQLAESQKQFAESIRQFDAALAQQKYETDKSIQMAESEEGKGKEGTNTLVNSTKRIVSKANPTKW